MRHARRKHNRISHLKLDHHLPSLLHLKRSSPKQERTPPAEYSIAFMRHRVEMVRGVVFEDTAFDPVVGLDGNTYRGGSRWRKDRQKGAVD